MPLPPARLACAVLALLAALAAAQDPEVVGFEVVAEDNGDVINGLDNGTTLSLQDLPAFPASRTP